MKKRTNGRPYTTVSVGVEAVEIVRQRARKTNGKIYAVAADLIRAGAAVLTAREGTR